MNDLRHRVGGETILQIIDDLEKGLREAPVSVPFERCECRQLPDGALLTCSGCARLNPARRYFCGTCGEWNRTYPDPCPPCAAKYLTRMKAEAKANAQKMGYCVLCGNESRTMVCSECSLRSSGKEGLSA